MISTLYEFMGGKRRMKTVAKSQRSKSATKAARAVLDKSKRR
jgi:hypothetical protein